MLFLGLVLGVAAATKQNTWVDYTTTIISVIAVSVPSFVLAVLLQYVFAVKLEWFPVAGWEGFSTAILPSLALSATVLATVARYIRAEMIEVLSSDYILLARAKGNSTLKSALWTCITKCINSYYYNHCTYVSRYINRNINN